MSTLLDLDSLIADKVFEAQGDLARLQDLCAALTAGAGLAIAIAAEGDDEVANVLCEAVAAQVFECAATHAGLALTARGLA